MWFAGILLLITSVNSYKILALFPTRGKSHSHLFLPLLKGLADKGHDLTVVSHFPLNEPVANYSDISLNRAVKNAIALQEFRGGRIQRWLTPQLLNQFSRTTCLDDFASPVTKSLVNMTEEFDLIIVQHFSSDCFTSLVKKFGAPFIGFTFSAHEYWSNEYFGNPSNPAYIPNVHLDHSDRMSFLGRVENFLQGVFEQLYYSQVLTKNGEEIAKQYFGRDSPPFREFLYNASLLFVPTHFTLNLPKPMVPAVIEVAGMHIRKQTALPDNLEKWINESTHGVIYLSLGSMIKGHTLPDEKKQEFLKAFGRLPQRVLWKWENETMPGKPDNVMIQKWMPQLDILCHPNVKAFISHGGLLGTTEAVHCGVPVLVMPQYGDQFTNAKALEANGGGIILHLYELTEEKLYNGLKTILDPKFKKQAEDLSARFRDRPLPPLETAIYWVEYVARHRGAHHMRTAAVGMPLYKYLLLDVIAFLLLVFVLISACFFYVTRAVFRKLFGRRDKQKTN